MMYLLLLFLFGYVLFALLADRAHTFYRDVRFWLVFASLCMLVYMSVHGYMLE